MSGSFFLRLFGSLTAVSISSLSGAGLVPVFSLAAAFRNGMFRHFTLERSISAGCTREVPPPPPVQLSLYEVQKHRDWNTFGHYLKNQRPSVPLRRCNYNQCSGHRAVAVIVRNLQEFVIGKFEGFGFGVKSTMESSRKAAKACFLFSFNSLHFIILFSSLAFAFSAASALLIACSALVLNSPTFCIAISTSLFNLSSSRN
nr:protein LIGHT-DEPENDENT SHORT HYPOCOTYLS 10-like [Ipomoea batatas]